MPDTESIALPVGIGIAEYPKDAGNLDELYLSASRALLYHTRETGLPHLDIAGVRFLPVKVNIVAGALPAVHGDNGAADEAGHVGGGEIGLFPIAV